SVSGGRRPGMLNVEELATIWHFPNAGTVKAPLIQMAPGRKAEPPMTLPQAEERVSEEKAEPLFLSDLREENGAAEKPAIPAPEAEAKSSAAEELGKAEDEKGTPPENLPFV
ncbi:MAG TPA: hypothetical protein VMC41_00110, partial [Candidatus Nanoarchaeia archaeon]|nr:hypothetical protein [Candidatus Nanoarchaeia archaeon]